MRGTMLPNGTKVRILMGEPHPDLTGVVVGRGLHNTTQFYRIKLDDHPFVRFEAPAHKVFEIAKPKTIEEIANLHGGLPITESPPDLDKLLEDWQVHGPGEWTNEISERTKELDTWYAVSNTNGIIAYFGNEADAYRFRLAEINRILNG